MVMDACPSPQSVGREFVRQYYTLLNQAPSHLHRFYNNFSSFVHGGLDAPNRETLPVIGQKQIHNRIQQLNFRDCHAKISQVDAQATLGGGVVVQVTGELSNGGAPMRRFTQTFVLAAQSPKKYYVHNDIFRYQDIVVSDEEGEGSASGENRSEGSEEERGFFPPPPAFPPAFPPPPAEPAPAPASAPNPAPAHNGHAHTHSHPHLHDDAQINMHSSSLSGGGGGSAVSAAATVAAEEAGEEEPAPAPAPPAPASADTEPEPDTHAGISAAAAVREPSQPKTYANLLKSVTQPPRHNTVQPVAAAAAPVAAAPSGGATRLPPRAVEATSAHAPSAHPHNAHAGGGGSGEGGAGVGSGAGRRFAEAAQLFFGNVPPHATEHALRLLFAKFGAVAELRLHGRGGAGGGAGAGGARAAPAYGFVTFESPAAARHALAAQPIYFGTGAESTKLNLEEKKRREPPPRRRAPSPARPAYRR